MKIYIYLITVLFSSTIFAIESSDILKVSIIKHYDKNVLVLNRGLEDGIYKADHIKLTNREGYIARAICIKASMLISHWKVYRVVRPELMSYDSVYTLTSMNQSGIPKELQAFQKALFNDDYNDISDKDVNKVIDLQQERIVKFDLPNDMSNDPMVRNSSLSESEVFLNKNFNAKKLQNDFSNYNFSVYTSPISWQSQNSQKSINYGFSLSNIGQKYESNFTLNKRESKIVDQYLETEVTSSSTDASFSFNINHITENVSYFMYASYRQARNGEIYYPRTQVQGGLLGFKYHFIENGPSVSKFDISYITLIDYMEFDSQQFNFDTFETDIVNDTHRTVRHSIRLRLKARLSDQTSFNSTLWYKPAMDISTQEMDFNDTMTNWTTSLSWMLTSSISASYVFIYTNDINQERDFGVDPMNQINTLNIQYNTIF